MSHSVTEIEALATKAARGAGAPMAQAARFGAALTHHLANHRDPQTLCDALDALPQGPILTLALHAETTSELGKSYAEAAARAPLPERLHPSEDLLNLLQTLAQKTYVPATEASRRAGAGAGLTDND